MASKKTSAASGKRKGSKPTPVQTAYVSLLSTADQTKSAFESVVAPFDITGQQYNVLRILRGAEPEGLPTLTIAQRMIERTPGITRMIDRLEAKGLAVREVRSRDRRCVHCRITEKGLSVLKSLDQPADEATHEAFRALSKTELQQLIALLTKMRS
jgi:MarR family transcriptional regulator, organic hydroperoxide resistance regulator